MGIKKLHSLGYGGTRPGGPRSDATPRQVARGALELAGFAPGVGGALSGVAAEMLNEERTALSLAIAGGFGALGVVGDVGKFAAKGGSKILKYVGTKVDDTTRRYVPEGQDRFYNWKRDTEYVHVDDLLELRGNKLNTGGKSVERLKKEIIEEGGLRDPVLLTVGKNSKTAAVGEGNHRVMAAKELGYEYVPTRATVGRELGHQLRSDVIPKQGEYFPSEAKPSEVLSKLRTLPLAFKKAAPAYKKIVAGRYETKINGHRVAIDRNTGVNEWALIIDDEWHEYYWTLSEAKKAAVKLLDK